MIDLLSLSVKYLIHAAPINTVRIVALFADVTLRAEVGPLFWITFLATLTVCVFHFWQLFPLE